MTLDFKDYVACEWCHGLTKPRGLKAHQRGKFCQAWRRLIEVEARGFEQVMQQFNTGAVVYRPSWADGTNVEFHIVPMFKGVWPGMPEWRRGRANNKLVKGMFVEHWVGLLSRVSGGDVLGLNLGKVVVLAQASDQVRDVACAMARLSADLDTILKVVQDMTGAEVA